MRYFIVALLVTALPAFCSAEIYKWIDGRGHVGYSDDLGKVPAKYRDSAVLTEKQEQAVEIIEKSEPEKGVKKGSDGKVDSTAKEEKGKDKPAYEGKTGEAWKQDFARLKHELKSLEDQSVGIKERMADSGKISRGEYIMLQNTQRDLEVRIGKVRKKLDALNDSAEKAGVPAEFR